MNDANKSSPKRESSGDVPELVAEHLALDLLNTVPKVNGELVDALQDDDDVLRWLATAGLPLAGRLKLEPLELLRAARRLRAVIRSAVEAAAAGEAVDGRALNRFLAKAESRVRLAAGPGRSLRVERYWGGQSAEQMLGPIAEAAGELLATRDFNLIRQCEDETCVLWFYDHTKAHRRRWCSMATCGNRNKVAAFRERQQQHGVER